MKEIVEKIRVQLEASPEVFEESFKYDLRMAELIIKDPYPLPADDLDIDLVIRRLRESKLQKPKYRNFWLTICSEVVEVILEKPEIASEEWLFNKKKLMYSLGKTDLPAKIFWLQLIKSASKTDLWTETEINSMEVLAPRFRARHLRNLIKFMEYKLKGREILSQKTIEDLNDLVVFLETLNLSKNAEELPKEEILELLEDYRNSLKFCHEVVRNLQQSMMKDLRQMSNLKIEEWIAGMNSASSGFLLDAFYTLLNNKENNLEHFQNFLSLFRNFLQKTGIRPIYPKEQMLITDEDLPYIELIGEPLKNGGKKVAVLAPGWKYKDRVIAKARVVEVNSNE